MCKGNHWASRLVWIIVGVSLVLSYLAWSGLTIECWSCPTVTVSVCWRSLDQVPYIPVLYRRRRVYVVWKVTIVTFYAPTACSKIPSHYTHHNYYHFHWLPSCFLSLVSVTFNTSSPLTNTNDCQQHTCTTTISPAHQLIIKSYGGNPLPLYCESGPSPKVKEKIYMNCKILLAFTRGRKNYWLRFVQTFVSVILNLR